MNYAARISASLKRLGYKAPTHDMPGDQAFELVADALEAIELRLKVPTDLDHHEAAIADHMHRIRQHQNALVRSEGKRFTSIKLHTPHGDVEIKSDPSLKDDEWRLESPKKPKRRFIEDMNSYIREIWEREYLGTFEPRSLEDVNREIRRLDRQIASNQSLMAQPIWKVPAAPKSRCAVCQPVDTGMRKSWCRDCERPFRFDNGVWVAE